jgi:hypothetical protein
VANQNVTVQVDINAAGNLKNSLKDLLRDVEKIRSATGASFGASAGAVFRRRQYELGEQMQLTGFARRMIGSPEHMQMLRTQIALEKERFKLEKDNRKAELIARYGQVGGRAANAAEAIGLEDKIKKIALWGTGAALGAVGAASPDMLATFGKSIQLLAGTVGQELLPAMITVTRWVQNAAKAFNGLSQTSKETIGSLTTVGLGLALSYKFLGGKATAAIAAPIAGFAAGYEGARLISGSSQPAFGTERFFQSMSHQFFGGAPPLPPSRAERIQEAVRNLPPGGMRDYLAELQPGSPEFRNYITERIGRFQAQERPDQSSAATRARLQAGYQEPGQSRAAAFQSSIGVLSGASNEELTRMGFQIPQDPAQRRRAIGVELARRLGLSISARGEDVTPLPGVSNTIGGMNEFRQLMTNVGGGQSATTVIGQLQGLLQLSGQADRALRVQNAGMGMAGGALAGAFGMPAGITQRQGQELMLSMSRFQPQQINVENLHDILQGQVVRAPLDQALFDMERRSFERIIELLGNNGDLAGVMRDIAGQNAAQQIRDN